MRLRAVRQRGDRLRSAAPVHLGYPQQICGCQRCRLRIRRHHHDPLHSRHLRRNRRHQQRRRQRIPPARHIASHRPQRPHHLPQLPAADLLAPRLRHLPVGESPDIRRRPPQRLARLRRSRLPPLLDFLLRHPQRLPFRQAIPQCGIAHQRLVAALPNRLNDPPHRRLNFVQPRCLASQSGPPLAPPPCR